MCGIVGTVGLDDRSLLTRMNAAQRHRGPDDSGEYWDDAQSVGMAMRRLTILDFAGGRQPMLSDDGGVCLVFNGEIFNARELRSELEAKGCKFQSDHSDTEVILRLYEVEGEAVADRLNGMFAFVIYDRRRKRLFGARDPYGIKPLFLHQAPGVFAWASELKSFLSLPTFSREIDPLAAEQYLGLQYMSQERTIYASASRLRPGHVFSYTLGNDELKTWKYFQLPIGSNRSVDTTSDATDIEIRRQFTCAVARWSQSDVPIACSLSGGIDSAAIVACLARTRPNVATYTLGFGDSDGADSDELADARRVAELYGTDHHEIVLNVDDLIGDLPGMLQHLDEPYGGGLPSWYVFREMSKDVKVAMTGTGGDELFSNYNKFLPQELWPKYRMAQFLSDRLPGVSRSLYNRARRRRDRGSGDSRRLRGRHRLADSPLLWLHPFGIMYPTGLGRGFNERLSSRDCGALSPGRQLLAETFNEYAGECLRDRYAAVDFENQLPEEFLFMTDRFSMAHSLEARTPFLDREFSAFVLGIDADRRLSPDIVKALLRNAFRDWLPKGHTDLEKKGFVLPLERWLRGALSEQAHELFSPVSLKEAGIVRTDFHEAFYVPFLAGEPHLTPTIWTVFMFCMWHKHMVAST